MKAILITLFILVYGWGYSQFPQTGSLILGCYGGQGSLSDHKAYASNLSREYGAFLEYESRIPVFALKVAVQRTTGGFWTRDFQEIGGSAAEHRQWKSNDVIIGGKLNLPIRQFRASIETGPVFSSVKNVHRGFTEFQVGWQIGGFVSYDVCDKIRVFGGYTVISRVTGLTGQGLTNYGFRLGLAWKFSSTNED